MEQRAPDGDPTEGFEVVDDDDDIENYDGIGRIVRWKRTITVTGPIEWVEETRDNSLAQGVHVVRVIDDTPCLIEVDDEEGETLRLLRGITSTRSVIEFRVTDPERYEKVHGPGTATEHADHNEAERITKKKKPTIVDTAVGQYL